MMTQVQGHSRDPSKDFIRGRCGRGVRPYRFPRPAPISTPTSSGSPSSTTIIFPTIGPTSPINVVESPPPIDTPYHFYSSETPNRPHLSPLVVLSTIGSFPRHPVPPTPPARPVQPTFRPTANIPPLYTKPLSWRTTPCRHFSKRGYCPLGDNCNFIHDPMFTSTGPQRLSQHASATQQPSDQKDSADTTQSNYNRIGGVVNVEVSSAPKKQSHCWAHVQGLCRLKDCQYFHPQDITPCTNDFSFIYPSAPDPLPRRHQVYALYPMANMRAGRMPL
ncbi:hypothetical protein JAAARDRAFT_304494 [Jaapia argillacea MUCL 33604]|uniref:C3H1-type domain-containing protein n=1 Tax=Jaapia argillacea MUCL 33604 TaxID=933084 RepID=A0A067PQ05_9AGAM|nr:hypothetical protein JAAARDRAFT_304494 [Jaapia argillacea MUCL 33604]